MPLLYSPEDAKNLVASAKFPPQGKRGFGSPFPMERFHPSLGSSDYLQQANDAILTMVQIETKEALESVEEIAAVPGIDVLFVGKDSSMHCGLASIHLHVGHHVNTALRPL